MAIEIVDLPMKTIEIVDLPMIYPLKMGGEIDEIVDLPMKNGDFPVRYDRNR
jgi:hypothetical protein